MNKSTEDYLNTFPSDIKTIDIDGTSNRKLANIVNGLVDLSRFTKLENIFIIGVPVTILTSIPKSIKTIYCPGNFLMAIHLNKEHVNLTDLRCKGNKISKLVIPDSLIYLECLNNKLEDLEVTPNIEYLDCSSNRIGFLSIKSKNIRNIYCSNNDMKWLSIDTNGNEDFVTMCCCKNPNLEIENVSGKIRFKHHGNLYYTCNP